MTPKDKAEELITEFSEHVTTWDCYNDAPEEPEAIREDAIYCALICVNKILIAQKTVYTGQSVSNGILFDEFWNGVKEYLNNELKAIEQYYIERSKEDQM